MFPRWSPAFRQNLPDRLKAGLQRPVPSPPLFSVAVVLKRPAAAVYVIAANVNDPFVSNRRFSDAEFRG